MGLPTCFIDELKAHPATSHSIGNCLDIPVQSCLIEDVSHRWYQIACIANKIYTGAQLVNAFFKSMVTKIKVTRCIVMVMDDYSRFPVNRTFTNNKRNNKRKRTGAKPFDRGEIKGVTITPESITFQGQAMSAERLFATREMRNQILDYVFSWIKRICTAYEDKEDVSIFKPLFGPITNYLESEFTATLCVIPPVEWDQMKLRGVYWVGTMDSEDLEKRKGMDSMLHTCPQFPIMTGQDIERIQTPGEADLRIALVAKWFRRVSKTISYSTKSINIFFYYIIKYDDTGTSKCIGNNFGPQ